MKYSKGLIISTAALSILATGCVKKSSAETPVVYGNSQPVYESGSPIVYETPGTSSSSGTIYNGASTDNTVISTTDAYGQSVASQTGTTYGQSSVGSSAGGAYGQPTTSSTSGVYGGETTPSSTGGYNNNNPYGTDTSYANPYANQPIAADYPSSSTGVQGGGIHLQIAALKDYYAAQEFKNSLRLDPKYSAYIQRGAINKVIISGISSVSEANQLKATRFPDAFIVSGSATSTGLSSGGGYTINTPYGNTGASTGTSNGIGVQIGAFSTHSRAQNAAESASRKYAPLVKKVTRNGKRLYKAILTGFSSEQEARSFIAQRGSGFLVHGL